MQVKSGVHLQLADGVKMHDFAVIGDVGDLLLGEAEVLGRRVVHGEFEVITAERDGGWGGLVDVVGVVGCFGVPPLAAAVDGEGHDNDGRGERDEAAAAKRGRGLGARRETSLANGSGYDPGHGEDEEQAKQSKAEGHGLAHREDGDGHGDDWDGGGLRASRSVGFDADLPGTARHDPDGAGEEGGVAEVLLHGVGGGRMPGGFAGDRERRDPDPRERRTGAANLDCGDAGDDVGRTDGDVQGIGAGVDGLEDVLRSNMGERGRGKEDWRKAGSGCGAGSWGPQGVRGAMVARVCACRYREAGSTSQRASRRSC